MLPVCSVCRRGSDGWFSPWSTQGAGHRDGFGASWLLTPVMLSEVLNCSSCSSFFPLPFFLLMKVGKNFEGTFKFCTFVRMKGSRL